MELLLGQIPQAIYLALFLIFTKEIKTKRILFVGLMILGYVGLTRIIHFDIWLNILHTVLIYITLKFLYKDKTKITDIITFFISILILSIINFITYIPFNILYNMNNNMLFVYLWFICGNGTLILITYLLKNKLFRIEQFYNKFWNRHTNSTKIKSVTIRGISAISINIIFYLSYLIILYSNLVNN